MITDTAAFTDSELVARCLDGNRDAFRELVERYQTLICSLAYSGCGDLQLSEEIAQETFLAAWRKMAGLREPEKCKSWLCGIARNLTQSALRSRGRTTTAQADSLDEVEALPATGDSPHEQTVTREEESMLWTALQDLPELYREPLILFYREAESVATVAKALDISEDAVKQRLSRGRIMLTEHIERSIRATLRVTAPGTAFAIGVLASISALTASAKAASLGVAAAKGSVAAKAAGIGSWLLWPALIFAGNYFSYRIGMESARTEGERAHMRRYLFRLIGIVVGFNAVAALIIWGGLRNPSVMTYGFSALALIFVGALVWFSMATYRERRQLIELRRVAGIPMQEKPDWEYRSAARLIGFPLIHVRVGSSLAWNKEPVKAWIAVGDRAYGLLFAFGGIAVAPVSVGGLALGLVSWGGCAAGVFALGGVCLGAWGFGGIVFAWDAFGGCAFGWRAAMGGIAIAREYALGGFACALHANNPVADQWMRAQTFFRSADFLGEHMQWMNLLWALPLLQWWRIVRKRSGKSQAGAIG